MSSFEIVPSIPVAYGRVISYEPVPNHGHNPLAAAWHWISQGAQRIHVEELSLSHHASPALLLGCRPSLVPVQVGGGIRDPDYARVLLQQGADRLVISHSWRTPELFRMMAEAVPPSHLMVAAGLDETSSPPIQTSLRHASAAGVRDVLLMGVWSTPTVFPSQTKAVKRCQAEGLRVWAAGGIRHLETVRRLKQLGISGIMVGKALYDGSLSFESLKQLADPPFING
ncbi:HisA/HisF-related TIM barrel protein [Sulfobacillus harzensis]|uniref:1-(5-phosphoribosyl)-5-[(5-phosphoribosylamino)methylideneamino] imidazole-4-carboxamide isomerase n=1 Tax=Sulfobacillus harzensis TaxID=2729629 RepID=A0A7Y0L439_9FIRM|nr:HisA/HisF-related TIM barrel protein [Sulfobacillus harzensis]NMP22964.1 1-(5-phosphoribosyl)-5-[(5-phosphoribosylamino)methylideneamino] imidazole-4-carboxamide isomerase [Sulfobacillus harzensis]